MRITRIAIKNFRSIKEATMEVDRLTSILGRNGAGKSAFLQGIKTFYEVSANIDIEDFYNKKNDGIIEISITFTDLRDDEIKEFESYIREDNLTVTKKIFFEGGKLKQVYYGSVKEIKIFNTLREKTKTERTKAFKELLAEKTFDGLEGSPTTGDAVNDILAEYEKAHPHMTELVEKETQFFGAVGGGKIDNFTKFVFIPAVRDVSDETYTKQGAIQQILKMIILRKINSRDDVKDFKKTYQDAAEKLFCDENMPELSELGTSISTTLKMFSPGAELSMSWEKVCIPEISLPNANIEVMEDDFKGKINRKGHGLQRALILTLLQHLAMTAPEKEDIGVEDAESAKNGQEKSASKDAAGPDLILAIEEPELYLHPSRSKYLADLFLKIAGGALNNDAPNNQILLTSHSPHFVDMNRFEQIRIVKKERCPEEAVMFSTVKLFGWDNAKKIFANIYNEDSAKVTKRGFIARSLPVINTVVSEGFFADAVVVVEGLSEIGVLWKLQEILNMNWLERNIVLVPAGSKNSIDRPVVVFRGFEIPTYFIFDGDIKHKGNGKDEQSAIIANHRCLRLAGVTEEDFPDSRVEDFWAVFRSDIETEIKAAIGDDYETFQKEVADELSYDKPSSIMKNIQGCCSFVTKVYEKGKKLDMLEQIVMKVSGMVKQ